MRARTANSANSRYRLNTVVLDFLNSLKTKKDATLRDFLYFVRSHFGPENKFSFFVYI